MYELIQKGRLKSPESFFIRALKRRGSQTPIKNFVAAGLFWVSGFDKVYRLNPPGQMLIL